MPLTPARLQEYITTYDVDLNMSYAAYEEEEQLILGIAMLGKRPGRTWITRLGVVPYSRRLGTGRALMNSLVEESVRQQVPELWLEVIKNNEPAYQLFLSMGFELTRELIVSRRPPSPIPFNAYASQYSDLHVLDHEQIMNCLTQRRIKPNWLNETESFSRVKRLAGLWAEFPDGGRGWVVCETSIIQLKRVVVEVVEGDPAQVAAGLLYILHSRFPTQDAVSENIPTDDPCWPGYEAMGYFDSFHRLEMLKDMTKG